MPCPCDTPTINGKEDVLLPSNLSNLNGRVVTDGLAVGLLFSRGHGPVNKKGIIVIHEHVVVQHHPGLLPHPWGGRHAFATKLFTALGALCTLAGEQIFQKFANSTQLVLCDKLQRMRLCLPLCST